MTRKWLGALCVAAFLVFVVGAVVLLSGIPGAFTPGLIMATGKVTLVVSLIMWAGKGNLRVEPAWNGLGSNPDRVLGFPVAKG